MLYHGLAVVLRAGKNVYQDALTAEFAAEITHVHIHAAGFFTAEHGQRTGVDG
jgi:hypothetical protein